MAMKRSTAQRRQATDLQQALAACRSTAWVLAGFSLVINLLMLTSPLYMIQVYDRVLTSGRLETLAMITLIAAVSLMLLAAIDTLRSTVTARMSIWFNDRLGPVVLENGVRARLLGEGSGGQGLRDISQIQAFMASQGLTVFFDAPWTPVFLLVIWALHPTLGIMAAGSAVVLLGLSVANEYVTRKPNATSNVAQIAASQQAEATIRNAEVVRAMGMLPMLTERWRRTNQAALMATLRSAERGGILLGMTKFVRYFVQTAILGLGAMLVLKSEISGGAMIASSILLSRALAPVELAMTSWRHFGNARIAYARLKARLQALPPESERIRLPTPLGHLSVDHVSYGPANAKAPVLQGVSFNARPGEAIAVIGPSAGGKSTLCRLLVGIALPSAGKIRLDGSELGHWDPDQLGQHIGYLPQDVELFAGTVAENIARFHPDADDDSIIAAATLAHAHEMIQQLPEGYKTQIGDAGARLSGGQRQRIGLARAIYGNPRLIILDEPNANLDQAGESALAAAVSELKEQGAALIIVGHRPSTLAQATKVLLLRDGKVELFGPRDEVLQRMRGASTGGKSTPVPMHKPAAVARHGLAAVASALQTTPDEPDATRSDAS
ncbi:type I secretion system permease/ATPase [Microvirga sp. VF16]|uniref:type I secretion system permease/ATPase n=1 Tax=Microvirga sp. VF16 TaxID=2807101 RepID=UPI00193D3ED7|nr:type I secretion system permease/ATPase [Microvirga sp. VF16]QRM35976.1 type I secretion system permease/ATPase [Microvirga sp. VF16]